MQIYGKVLFNKANIFFNFDNYFPGVFFTVLYSKQNPCSKFNLHTKNGMSVEQVNKELRTLRRITKFSITKWLHFV